MNLYELMLSFKPYDDLLCITIALSVYSMIQDFPLLCICITRTWKKCDII